MEIHRYLNGKAVTEGELSVLSLTTPALVSAVRDAGRRAERERPSFSSFKEAPLTPQSPTPSTDV